MEIESDSRFIVNQQKPNEICVPWNCYHKPKNGVSKETLVQMKHTFRLFNTPPPPPLTSTTLCLIYFFISFSLLKLQQSNPHSSIKSFSYQWEFTAHTQHNLVIFKVQTPVEREVEYITKTNRPNKRTNSSKDEIKQLKGLRGINTNSWCAIF
ncbi:hypothetical protein HanXRQr2_Chr09g0396521 [Helianthus annuus]|uniref:Uncharacterized protein n=1 Tax=Helianthus annuus TaxID=4232 RepID=A0A9K3I6Z5_HELAN|nr:hypothetical protein HanXRQr2_Chr09g0396521 [Helianthus annuus]KAJ0893836.1 hypothetical protein HanPSC8_Chr09g0382291 [Helianthus annuus]